MSKISNVNAIQVFDSRGIPTIACEISLDNGICASAMVPSGASTGSKEALELRDSDSNYHGKGVLNAISNINNKLGPLLIGGGIITTAIIFYAFNTKQPLSSRYVWVKKK